MYTLVRLEIGTRNNIGHSVDSRDEYSISINEYVMYIPSKPGDSFLC